MDYAITAPQILEQVGGEQNVSIVTHCMTRLRFVLKDQSIVDDEKVKAIPGVISVVKGGGQYQIVIGNNVAACYKELLKLGHFDDGSATPASAEKKKVTPKTIFTGILDAIAGSMSPLIGAIVGAGLLQVLYTVLKTCGVATTSTSMIALYSMGQACFYFLPILVAFAAGKKFGTNSYVCAAVVAVLIYPSFVTTFNGANGGTLTLEYGSLSKFLGIPVLNATYTSSVIPPILIAYMVKWVEVGVDKITPAITKNFLKPFLIMLIACPLAFIVVGPIGALLGMGFEWIITNLNTYVPVLVAIIMAVACPYLVMTGMHWALVPLGVAALYTPNGEQLILPAMLAANISMGGATLAIAAREKDKEARSTALGAGISACVGGITEPALYGVLLPRKKPLAAVAVSCFVCGLINGLTHIGGFSFVSPSFLGLTAFIKDGDAMNIVWASVVAGIAFVMAFGLTFFMPELSKLFDKMFGKQIAARKAKKATAVAGANGNTAAGEIAAAGIVAAKKVFSPIKGKAVALTEVPDETFASGVLGKGMAIVPDEGKIYAPFDGTVETVMGHALGLKSTSGVEILIHVGLDTVNLNGKHYTCKVKQGDKIKAGQLLLECDLKAIKAAGYNTITPVIITNSDDYENIGVSPFGDISVGEMVLDIE